MLTKFRNLYPQGSILSELIDIDRGVYIVRVSIQINGITLATGLAGAEGVEKAEDSARTRALQALVLEDGNLSLNLATKTREKMTAVTVMPQEPIVTKAVPSTVKSPIINPPEPISLVSEPPAQAKAIPQPEPKPMPEPIPDSFEPELPVTILDDREEILEPPLELQPPEENYAISKRSASRGAEPVVTATPVTETPTEEFDFNQIRHKIDLEMKRLSWTKEQGRDYLLSTYGKRSRLHLTDDELLEFWHYLETLSN